MNDERRKTAFDDAPSMRIKAAVEYAEAQEEAERVTDGARSKLFCLKGFDSFMKGCDFNSFLDGWDAAMEVRFDELIQENTDLQSRLFDIQYGKDEPTP